MPKYLLFFPCIADLRPFCSAQEGPSCCGWPCLVRHQEEARQEDGVRLPRKHVWTEEEHVSPQTQVLSE